MPITADWLSQNHTAQQVTIQLLVRALSSSEYLCYVPPILDTQYWGDIAVEPIFSFLPVYLTGSGSRCSGKPVLLAFDRAVSPSPNPRLIPLRNTFAGRDTG